MSNRREEDIFVVAPHSRQSFRHKCIPSPADPNLKTVVHWFKPDCLRLDDNPGLNNAVCSAWEHKLMFQAIFILDPWYGNKYGDRITYGDNVMQFLFESLVDLDKQLMKYYGVKLRIYVGMPDEILRSLAVYWNIVKITFQSCKMFPEIIAYEDSLIKQFRSNKVWVEGFHSHSLYDPNDFSHLCKNHIPSVFEKFELFVKNRSFGYPKPPVNFHKTMPHFDFCSGDSFLDGIDLSMLHNYGFPTLDEVFNKDWKGGESEAQKKLSLLSLRKYTEDNTDYYDTLMSKDAFSPYIRFGCVSLKRLYYTLIINKTNSPARFVRMLKGLLKREHCIVLGNFAERLDCLEKNDLCVPIQWDINSIHLTAFRKGATGFPWIDAIICQILQEGWACAEARHSIASFLTRGCLWISWVEGVKFFQEYMLDFELSSSAVCWMHSARCFVGDKDDGFDPLEEGKKLDPEGKFIKKYIPELENYPKEFIHNPWELSFIDQKILNCVINEDYPKPLVNPKMIKIANMKKARKVLKK